ncbi:hypothetical protein pb186bvf_002831 [Paramecium bursaria]
MFFLKNILIFKHFFWVSQVIFFFPKAILKLDYLAFEFQLEQDKKQLIFIIQMGCNSGKKSKKRELTESNRVDQVSLVIDCLKQEDSGQINSWKLKQEVCRKKNNVNSNVQGDLTSIKLHHRNSKDSTFNYAFTAKDPTSEIPQQRKNVKTNPDCRIDDISQNLTISQNYVTRKSTSKTIKHSKEYNLSKLREIF